MMKVLDNQTGKPLDLEDDSNLPDLVASGSVSIPDKEYEFQDEMGDKYSVPAKGFLDAVKAGWKYRDSATLKDEELEKKYGDSPLAAGALSVARGLTLGLSDVALEKSGAVSEEALRELKSRNPVSSVTGEVIGSIAPILLSGGTSLTAQAASKTAPGLIAKFASRAGARAAQNVESKIIKGAISLGAEGVIEGAASGLGQTVSEAELGDAEFNAETLLANVGTGALIGGGLGAAVGGGVEYAKKVISGGTNAAKIAVVNNSSLPAAEKAAIIKQIKDGDEVRGLARSVFEDAEFKKVAAENGWPTTPGMESNLGLYQTLESSIAEGASAPAVAVRQNIDLVNDTIDNEIMKVAGTGEKISPLVAGDETKNIITRDIDSRLAPHRDFQKQLSENMGNAPFNEIIQKRAINRLEKSPSYRLASNPRASFVIGLIQDSKNLNDLEFARKQVGKILGGIRKTGADAELEDFMADAYATIKRAKKDAVIKNSLELGPKRGMAMAKKVVKAMDASDEAYKAIYKEYSPVADRLGISLKGGPDFFVDNLLEASSEKIGSRIIDMNDFRLMQDLHKSNPAIFEMARKVELGKIVRRSTDATTGTVSPVRFAKNIRGLTDEQRKIIFGFDGKVNARVDDLLKYIEKAPKKLNKSDTATAQFFQKILSPAYQASEYARYMLYKGGENAIKKHLLNDLPVFKAIESSSNKQKNVISSSVSSFFKAAPVGVAVASMKSLTDREIKKAEKSYEMVQSDPEALIDSFVKNNKDLSDAAPETANALQQRIIAGVQFLQSKTPKRDQEYIGEKMEPSRAELIKFNDYMEAVENPRVIFDQLKQGYMNSSSLEALRTVYPKIYQSIQAEVLAKMPKNLTRQQKIQLQPLLGSKVTPAMDYQNLMRLQGKTPQGATGQAQAEAAINHVPVGAAQKMKVSERAQTGLAKTLNRT